MIKILNEYCEYQEVNEDIELLKRDADVEDEKKPTINWENLKKKNPDIILSGGKHYGCYKTV